MKLYLIFQDETDDYDTYSDAVVAAENEEAAQQIWSYHYGTWCKSPSSVKVEYLGEAREGTVTGVICTSFHAAG